jgi:hypothetical protein
LHIFLENQSPANGRILVKVAAEEGQVVQAIRGLARAYSEQNALTNLVILSQLLVLIKENPDFPNLREAVDRSDLRGLRKAVDLFWTGAEFEAIADAFFP